MRRTTKTTLKLTAKQLECLRELARPCAFAVCLTDERTSDDFWFLPSIRKNRTIQVGILIERRLLTIKKLGQRFEATINAKGRKALKESGHA